MTTLAHYKIPLAGNHQSAVQLIFPDGKSEFSCALELVDGMKFSWALEHLQASLQAFLKSNNLQCHRTTEGNHVYTHPAYNNPSAFLDFSRRLVEHFVLHYDQSFLEPPAIASMKATEEAQKRIDEIAAVLPDDGNVLNFIKRISDTQFAIIALRLLPDGSGVSHKFLTVNYDNGAQVREALFDDVTGKGAREWKMQKAIFANSGLIQTIEGRGVDGSRRSEWSYDQHQGESLLAHMRNVLGNYCYYQEATASKEKPTVRVVEGDTANGVPTQIFYNR